MTYNEIVYTTLTRVCPGTYLAYKPGKAPPLPWFAYSPQYGSEVFADNSTYAKLPRYRVELFIKEHDPFLVERFEAALRELGPYSLYEVDYVDSENAILHDYRLSLDTDNREE